MPKRKVISESGKAPTKKLKGNSEKKASKSQLSFDSPRQCLQSLIFPKTLEEFFENFWEKEHLFIQRKNVKYYGDICTKDELLNLVKKEKLIYDSDLFVSIYSKADGHEDVINDAEEKATTSNINKHFGEKASVMLSRPHRFNKDVERMLQLLELYFGVCAYTHLEVTPSGCQGHAPCYVAREVFNLQLEGKKCWRLYKPIIKLATQDSEDLDESEIGEVLEEHTLEPGDVLYLPRGTVFQAASLDEQHSTDLSIELTYDENNWGKYISSIIDKAVTKASENDVSFRENLPINYLSYMGFGKNEKNSELLGTNSEVQSEFINLVPKLDKSDLLKQEHFEEKLKKMVLSLVQYLDPHWGADYLGTSFMGNRLAPTITGEPKNNNVPDDNSFVQMTYPEYVRIVFCAAGDQILKGHDEDDEDEAEEEASEEEEKDKKDKTKKTKASLKKEEKLPNGKQDSEKKSKKSSVKTTKKEKEAEEDEDENEDEKMEESCEDIDSSFEEKPACILVQHSLHNDNSLNDDIEMMTGILEFPVHYSDALLILHRSTKPVALKDLPLAAKERLELANTLCNEGLLVVKEST